MIWVEVSIKGHLSMNKELKRLLQISIGLLALILISINVVHDHQSRNFISNASKVSQIINTNRLRSARLNRPSEKWPYPKINHQSQLTLIGIKATNQLFVINRQTNRVIYIIHAKINVKPTNQPLKVLKARGQEIYHIHGAKQTTGQSWLRLSNQAYLEAPLRDSNNQPVSNDLLSTIPSSNLIYASSHDANWLQSIPTNTPVYIQEKK